MKMRTVLALVLVLPMSLAMDATANEIQKGEMAGYLLVPNEKLPETHDAGFSMYVTAWPLLDRYPDSSGIRKAFWNSGTLGPEFQLQESLPFTQPSQSKTDLHWPDYVTIADYDFNQKSVPQELQKHPADWPHHYIVQQFNFSETNYLIGESMGEAMKELLKK